MTITFDIETVPTEHRERVAEMIPDPRLADAYVHRSIGGIEDFDLMDVCVEEQENILLNGPTGSSKTSVFRAYAAARGLPFCLVECNASMDMGMVLGKTTIDKDGSVAWVDGELTTVLRYGGVALVDECNMGHPRLLAGFHQVLAVTRRMAIPEAGETIAAGRGGLGDPQPVLLGAAYNPRYQGGVVLNAAFKNRFAMQIKWDYLRDVEEQLVMSTRLLDMAENIRSLPEIRTPLATNALMEFERHADRLGFNVAAELLVGRFEPEEQAPIRRALEANAAAIADELGVAA